MNLYELTGEYLSLMAMADDPDIDPEVLADTLEAVEGEFEAKFDLYVKIIRQLEYSVAAQRAESKIMDKKAVAGDKKIDRIKMLMRDAMTRTGKVKFRTDMFSYWMQNTPERVVLDDVKKIPKEYLIEQDPKIDRMKIKEDIKAGKNLEGVAHLEQDKIVRFR